VATKLQITDLVKRFAQGRSAAVGGLTLAVDEGEMLVLLGPSGCGKTTTLQLIAGLMHPDAGSVVIDGQAVAGPGWGFPPEKRNLGMVFQSYAVWPHKTVAENVAYGLSLRRVAGDAMRRKVADVLDMVKLRGLEARYPSEISGGQQQRVALARAIVVNPSLLLLDEPLSNLDAALREQMRTELKSVQRELGLASVYVTHDQAEAMTLADRLVVMHDGVIVQQGKPEEVFSRPASRFVAGFLGTTNLLHGRIADVEGSNARLDITDMGELHGYVDRDTAQRLRTGANAWLSIRPIAVALSSTRPAGANALEGRVGARTFLGDLTEYTVSTGNFCWRVHAISTQRVTLGARAWISFAPDAATIMPDG
jgi:ABC-type Fe3+/spermidine/putrescine transport system ATPase subunit